jgi:FtsZ-interacting cell division protein YlmF
MSEYQYYEFRAVDRPLTNQQIRDLRRYSSRAEITATTFSVEYDWGEFKGNPNQWMERYFDAFVHFANLGSRWLMLRIPSHQVGSEIVSEYCDDDYLSFTVDDKNLILSFRSDDEDGDWVDGDGWLSSLVALRADLINGDHRCLYLAWLRSIQGWANESDGEEHDLIEPPVPAGLRTLNTQLEGFAEFLGIDVDLIAAAAEQSEDQAQLHLSSAEIMTWVRTLSPAEKDSVLLQIIEEDASHPEAALRRRVFLEMQTKRQVATSSRQRRTAAQIHARADEILKERKRIQVEKAEEERLRRKQEQAEQRRNHLESLRGRETVFRAKADQLIVTKQPRKYDEAVSILQDLRDLAEKDGTGSAFYQRMQCLWRDHASKPTLLQRFRKARLSPQL